MILALKSIVIIWIISLHLLKVSAFSNTRPTFSLLNVFQNSSDGDLKKKRQQVKNNLMNICQKPFGKDSASEITLLLPELRKVNPTPASSSSPMLFKKWQLLWTTEKEINFFNDFKLSKPNSISQTLTKDKIINTIPFSSGGSFEVVGTIEVNKDLNRVEFEFETANLNLNRWGQFSFPPIGAGWFEILYLDSDLRVDINSRNDILICIPSLNN